MYTIKKINWYVENGYKIEKLFIPSDLNLTERGIRDYVLNEYIIEDYEKNIPYLQKRWGQIEEELSPKLKKLNIVIPSEINILFTRYGVAGSYKSPNTIIVNVRKFWGDGLIKNILHELVHLIINPYIIESNINHWSKERIVDLIFLDLFPELNLVQDIKVDTLQIDSIFNRNYPDIKKVIIEIAKLK